MKKGARVITKKEETKIAKNIKSKLNSWNKKMMSKI